MCKVKRKTASMQVRGKESTWRNVGKMVFDGENDAREMNDANRERIKPVTLAC